MPYRNPVSRRNRVSSILGRQAVRAMPGYYGSMKRLSLRRFGEVVARVMETLPEEFRPYLDNVDVVVEEEADAETLRDAGLTDEEIEAGETIYGLFSPMPLP